MLGMSVEDVGQMKLPEYLGWIAYIDERNKRNVPGSDNLLEGTQEDLIKGLTDG